MDKYNPDYKTVPVTSYFAYLYIVLCSSIVFFLTLPAFSSVCTYFLFQLFLFTLFSSLLVHCTFSWLGIETWNHRMF